MRVIIAGGRDFNDYELLKEKMSYVQKHITVTEIISGGARGSDRLGERWNWVTECSISTPNYEVQIGVELRQLHDKGE